MQPLSVEEHIHQGLTAAREGDDIKARQHLIEATRLDPNQAEIWFWLGLVLDKPEKQLRCMQRAIALDPTHPYAQEAIWRLTAEGIEPEELDAPAESGTNGKAMPAAGPTEAVRRAVVRRLEADMSLAGESPKLWWLWLAALRFEGETVYEQHRARANAVLGAALMLWVVAIGVFAATAVVPLLPSLGRLDALDLGRFAGESFFYSLFIAGQVVLALLLGSWVSTKLARRRVGSAVSALEHFGLSALWYVPAGVGLAGLIAVLGLAGQAVGSNKLALPVLATLAAYGFYGIGQSVYSHMKIYRVEAGAALALSSVTLASAALVLAWLFPFTLDCALF